MESITLLLPHLHPNMFKVKMQNPHANIDRDVAGDIVQVIGAGLPRTGTSSLVAAMEILGFGPSFHFTEIYYNPEYAPIFERLLQAFRITGSCFVPKSKEESDAMKDQLKDIFRGYKSTFDTPACFFVPELMELYPHAKVLLSVRDSDEAWYKSMQDTILVTTKWWYMLLTSPIVAKPVNDLLKQSPAVLRRYSGGKPRKENHTLHNQWIKGIVPKERLLEVCKFSYCLLCLIQLMFGCGSLMSSRDGVRYVNSWEFQSQTNHFQECKFSISLSKISNMKYRNDTQSIRRRQVKIVLCGASLWVGYLGLGAGSLFLLFNPQATICLFSTVGRRIAGVLGWYS